MIQTKEATTFEKYPEYKDSGVEWLGELPMEWDVLKMKFLFRDVSIKNKPNEELLSVTQNQGVVPRTWVENRMVMPSGNLESFKFIRKGDFAISLRSFEGGLEYCHHDGIISPAYTVLKKDRKLVDNYYKYLFKSYSFISEIQTSVIGIREGKNISYPILSYSLLPSPSICEQTTIANFLANKTSKIDTAIAQKEQMIALLKERKQIVIQNAVTKGLNPNAKMKDSGVEWIGEIPKGWEVKKTKHFGTIKSGEGITNSELNEHGRYEVFGGNGLMGYSDRYNIDDECIIIGRVGALCGNVRLSKGKRFISDNALIFKSNKKSDTEYLRVVLTFADLNKLNTSNAQPLITGTKVMNQQFPFPDNDERLQILNLIESQSTKIDQAISLQQSQIEKLKEYKATLIDGAVTGKIKVSG